MKARLGIRKWLILIPLLFQRRSNLAQKSGRVYHKNAWISLPELTTLLPSKIHEVKQIGVPCHEVLGPRGDCEIDVGLVLRIAWEYNGAGRIIRKLARLSDSKE